MLHDALICTPGKGSFDYIYHLIDDTNHDSIMTDLILWDIIEKCCCIITSGHLVLRSDNCSTQYKSRYVFKKLLDIARAYKLQITWFYGEPGHGRGLIESIAWFGVKGPLMTRIINEDNWFPTASAMVEYINGYFINDFNKHHYVTDPQVAASIMDVPRGECKTDGCQPAHMMVFNKDGTFLKRNILNDSEIFMNLNFHEMADGCDSSGDESEDEQDDNETPATYNELVIDTSEIFSCISENSCCN